MRDEEKTDGSDIEEESIDVSPSQEDTEGVKGGVITPQAAPIPPSSGRRTR